MGKTVAVKIVFNSGNHPFSDGQLIATFGETVYSHSVSDPWEFTYLNRISVLIKGVIIDFQNSQVRLVCNHFHFSSVSLCIPRFPDLNKRVICYHMRIC